MRFRSILFTPASRIDRLATARDSGADWVSLDLEDGVAQKNKSAARAAVQELLTVSSASSLQQLALRINTLSSPEGIADMTMLLGVSNWPSMLILPKVESAKEIAQLRALATSHSQDPLVLASLETAHGVEQAARILKGSGPRLLTAYGSADHMAETGGTMGKQALSWARGRIVNAASCARIPVLDGVCLALKDQKAVRKEATLARQIGFDGKIAIHPAQIKPIHHAFAPTAQEVGWAKQVIHAAHINGGTGAFVVGTQMVDAPVLAQARRILANSQLKGEGNDPPPAGND
ncbi:HpcH/HpaI aldolase/citrate lyase family protein [Flexibacterium corallicola]|uniref:HpcH/HpaI aldolase/citrate lyase family protein n=1 Tax=Flexibacterium corallicola TaxID=3037259 RepID=UPI00286ECB9A|nr:CoA ester lyase [Pseudovibrio sp. M1P-2-3]